MIFNVSYGSGGGSSIRFPVTIPSQSGTITYNGSVQSPSWNNFDTALMDIGGDTSGTDAGDYTATFTIKDPKKYAWEDGSRGSKNIKWNIGRAVITAVPSQSGTLTYNEEEQSPVWSNYDSSKMTIDGETTATNAGTYTVTFTPTHNYTWSDGTDIGKEIEWQIGKANGLITVDKSEINLFISNRLALAS